METKKGVLTKKEKEFIWAEHGKLSATVIASKLHRPVKVVEKYIKDYCVVHKDEPSEAQQKTIIRQELRQSEEWGRLEKEFSPEELRLFEEKYVKLLNQFKNDVLPSEETQVFHLIKLEILMSRNLIARRKVQADAVRLEKLIKTFLDKFNNDASLMSDGDRQFLISMESQKNAALAAEQARSTEYKGLQQEVNKLMEKLKANRDQRIKEVESGKVDFVGLMKMLRQKEVADKEGRQMELMKMAGEREFNRLARPHEYDDKVVDLPILSAETIEMVDASLGGKAADESEGVE